MPSSRRRDSCDDKQREDWSSSNSYSAFLLSSIGVLLGRRRTRTRRHPPFDPVSFLPCPRRLPRPQLLAPGDCRLHHSSKSAPRRARLRHRRRRVPEAASEAGEGGAARRAAGLELAAEIGDDGGDGKRLPSPPAAALGPERCARGRRPPLPRRAPDRPLRRSFLVRGAEAEARGGEGRGVERRARRRRG